MLLISVNCVQATSTLIWEARLADFEDAAYSQAITVLLSNFEEQMNRSLSPGATGRVGLKVYAESGPGISTPLSLVKGLIAALEARGFQRKNLFIVGLEEHLLREAGFLPKLSEGGIDFEGVPVYALDTNRYWDSAWHYDNPLPSGLSNLVFSKGEIGEDRKSFLPMPLLQGLDFWINLPMITTSNAFGVSGALANPTIWAISNNRRFLTSPHNAPMAIAEMAAIPELQATWALTIVTLERYQFMAGPKFNALYTHSEPLLWLSTSAAALDYAALERINTARTQLKFYPLPLNLPLLEYTKALGLGDYRKIQWIAVAP